jgi:hypothetical protein
MLTRMAESLRSAGDALMGVRHRGTSGPVFGAQQVTRRRRPRGGGVMPADLGGGGAGGGGGGSSTLTPTRTFTDSTLLPNGGATITFGVPFGGGEDDRAEGYMSGLRRAMDQMVQTVREKGSEVHAALGDVGAQGMQLFGSFGSSIAGAFAEAFSGGDFGEALKEAVGQSIMMMGVQLTQAGIMSLLLAPLSFIPFFGAMYGPPGKLAAIGTALTAGGLAMTGLGASMSGGGAPGGVRGAGGAGAGAGGGGAGGTQPLRDGGPRFGPEFGMGGGMQPRVVNVQFNAPQDPRSTRRMLTDIMEGRG